MSRDPSRSGSLCALSIALACCAPAAAQVPAHDREALAISILPAPAAGEPSTITAHLSVSASNQSAPIDLSTDAVFTLNGTPLDTVPLSLSAQPATDSPCDLCDDPDSCVCDDTGMSTVCSCDIIVVSASTGAALQPMDEITVILIPAPGALPDDDTSNDSLTVSFEGDPLFWNRRITGVELTPAAPESAGDVFFDVCVRIDVEAGYDGVLDLAGDLELLVGGASAGSFPVFDQLTWNPCNAACDNVCVLDPAGGMGVCQPDDDGPLPCSCRLAPVGDIVFPDVEVLPGDEIIVLLRPAPGALPELPGFGDDDDRGLCLGDLDADGLVGVTDFLFLLAEWGPCPPQPDSCPADLDTDGMVGVTDFLLLLSLWGPCFPV